MRSGAITPPPPTTTTAAAVSPRRTPGAAGFFLGLGLPLLLLVSLVALAPGVAKADRYLEFLPLWKCKSRSMMSGSVVSMKMTMNASGDH